MAARHAARERQTAAEPTPDDLGTLDSLGTRLGAEIGATIGPPGMVGPSAEGGTLTSGPAWSTIKVPISLRVLEDAGGPSKLSPHQRELITRAITLSDNEAAAELFAGLERTHGGLTGASQAVAEMLRAAGDNTTQVSTVGRGSFSTYGQTEWSLPEQHRFMAALAGGCIGSEVSRRYLMGLMGQVTSDTWGLGSAGVPALWKGGWGPGINGHYLLRQMGVIMVNGSRAVITIAVRPLDGQFISGESIASRVAQWVARRAPRLVSPPTGC